MFSFRPVSYKRGWRYFVPGEASLIIPGEGEVGGLRTLRLLVPGGVRG